MAVLDFTFERREKLIARDSREEGREEGIAIGRRQVAGNMLKANKSIEEIKEFTGLSADTLKELANELEAHVTQA
ncbi:MAG: hypothetical protein PUF12_04020 [Thermoflexaceae bacterium]|nr:hypothetical protein [Thermoflexaceae bacterium]